MFKKMEKQFNKPEILDLKNKQSKKENDFFMKEFINIVEVAIEQEKLEDLRLKQYKKNFPLDIEENWINFQKEYKRIYLPAMIEYMINFFPEGKGQEIILNMFSPEEDHYKKTKSLLEKIDKETFKSLQEKAREWCEFIKSMETIVNEKYPDKEERMIFQHLFGNATFRIRSFFRLQIS